MSGHYMRAMRFHAVNEPLRMENLPVPDVGENDVLICVKAIGICGSDLHILYEGNLPTAYKPIVLGHESSGVIAAVGRGVSNWQPGDRVIVDAVLNCGKCSYCHSGRASICPDTRIIGIHTDGAMAEYMIAPASHVLRLPDSISFEHGAVLTDAAATPYHAIVKRGMMKQGESVAVIGCGGLGYHAVQLCKILGASRIIAVDTNEVALRRAEKVGATDLVQATSDAKNLIRRITGDGVDLVLEFVGHSATISLGTKVLRAGGRLVVSGVGHENIVAPPPSLFVWKEYSLIGSFSYDLEDISNLLELVKTGVLDLSGSVTETFPLEEANTAMEHLRDKIGNPIRIVIQP